MTTVLATTEAANPSPYDADGVQYAWDSTSLGQIKECPRKYYLSQIEGWRLKTEAIDLVFGIWYHQGLEYYDKIKASKGLDHDQAVLHTVRHMLEATWVPADDKHPARPWSHDNPKKSMKTRWTLIRSIVWYLEQFGDNDPAQTVILANGTPAVELSFRFEIDRGLMLCGHLDRVVDYLGDYYVMDRKTAGGTIGEHYFKQFSPHNQMTLYSLASRIAFQTPVKGVIIDAAQIGVGFTRFQRGMTHRTQRQLDEFLQSVYSYHGMAVQFTADGFWPMNETACDKFGGCVFRDICGKDPAVRGRFLATYFTNEWRWNPLVAR